MRGGIITTQLDGPPTGPERYLRELCERLPAAAPDIDWVFIHHERTDDSIYHNPAVDEALVSRIPGMFEREISALNLNFVHYNYIPYRRPWFLALDIPTVITVHGDLPYTLPEYVSARRRYIEKPMVKMLAKCGLLTNVDFFITVSNSTVKILRDVFAVSRDKFEVIPHGVDEKFSPVGGTASHVPSSYFLFVGNASPVKNLETTVRALALLADRGVSPPPLLVAGEGWHTSEAADLAEKLAVDDRVQFLGPVDNDALPALYRGALAYVNPSRHETFGLTNLEAMACGCPVVTTSQYGIPEVVDNAAVMFADPDDFQELSRQLHELMTSPARRDTLSKAGLERAATFSWDRAVNATVSVYRRAADTHSA
ncbi:glycosyltransferase family 1 protein [Halorubrum ezzemoulense]|uniref:glycosyltransferase family 4 protein n=1 Tax=Halorubrum ezzemoulense TaxID=337243 RepID=UPI00232CCD94|nr:glycosyltransferase family 1 protein [Halorubrum ezzemoulense]MDB2283297.1 glycosyltransferase family 1 protein [Halorubrum ezzemoulense]